MRSKSSILSNIEAFTRFMSGRSYCFHHLILADVLINGLLSYTSRLADTGNNIRGCLAGGIRNDILVNINDYCLLTTRYTLRKKYNNL